MLSREEDAQLRAIGRRAIESARRSAPGSRFSRDFMTVTAVRGAVLDVSAGDERSPLVIEGVPMTTACAGVKTGDVVVVDTYRHKPLAVGVVVS